MKIAFITPSYAPDFERCRLLTESFSYFFQDGGEHFIIVAPEDYQLFRQLHTPKTKIIIRDDMLPQNLINVPLSEINGWILQQIVKLSVSNVLDHDLFFFVDSDTAFIRPFDLTRFMDGEKVSLFCKPEVVDSDYHRQMHPVINRLLGIKEPVPDYDYIAQLILWRRDVLTALHQYIEHLHQQYWVNVLIREENLSEYTLYAKFARYIVGEEKSGHFLDAAEYFHYRWHTPFQTEEELKEFIFSAGPDCLTIMISSKIGFEVSRYKKYIREIWGKRPLLEEHL